MHWASSKVILTLKSVRKAIIGATVQGSPECAILPSALTRLI